MLRTLKNIIPERFWRVSRNQAARFGMLPCVSGTHGTLSPEDIASKAREYFEDYSSVGRLDVGGLRDKRVLEIGPGNNFAVALLFLAAGVRQFVCIDRFRARPNPSQAKGAYALLMSQMSKQERARCQAVMEDGDVIASADGSGSLEYYWDCSVEQAHSKLGGAGFDLIISRSVLEHVYSVEGAIASMGRLLQEGGHMIHKVDLRSHEEATESHPLDFLCHGPHWWRWMTSATGEPNRARKQAYLRALTECGFEIRDLRVTHAISRDQVAAIRTRLADPFRHLQDEELMHTGIFFDAYRIAPSGT